MELNYRYSESTVKPAALEIAEGSVYFRKEITSVTRTSEQGDETVFWTYQEAELTPQEFNNYASLLMAEYTIKGKDDSANIVQLMAGQEAGDGNQLIIMEAIADLYDAVAALM
jgi:hypothetical protein